MIEKYATVNYYYFLLKLLYGKEALPLKKKIGKMRTYKKKLCEKICVLKEFRTDFFSSKKILQFHFYSSFDIDKFHYIIRQKDSFFFHRNQKSYSFSYQTFHVYMTWCFVYTYRKKMLHNTCVTLCCNKFFDCSCSCCLPHNTLMIHIVRIYSVISFFSHNKWKSHHFR